MRALSAQRASPLRRESCRNQRLRLQCHAHKCQQWLKPGKPGVERVQACLRSQPEPAPRWCPQSLHGVDSSELETTTFCTDRPDPGVAPSRNSLSSCSYRSASSYVSSSRSPLGPAAATPGPSSSGSWRAPPSGGESDAVASGAAGGSCCRGSHSTDGAPALTRQRQFFSEDECLSRPCSSLAKVEQQNWRAPLEPLEPWETPLPAAE